MIFCSIVGAAKFRQKNWQKNLVKNEGKTCSTSLETHFMADTV